MTCIFCGRDTGSDKFDTCVTCSDGAEGADDWEG